MQKNELHHCSEAQGGAAVVLVKKYFLPRFSERSLSIFHCQKSIAI